MDRSNTRRRWLIPLFAAGIATYGIYKLYNLPSVARNRRKLSKLVQTLSSVTDAVSSSAATVSLLSADLNRFLCSDSDQIPTSLRQISKIATSDEVSRSISRVSEAITAGMIRSARSTGLESGNGPDFADRVLDRLFSSEVEGFVSAVSGSVAKGLTLGFCSAETSSGVSSEVVVELLCGEKVRIAVEDWIRVFVSSAVEVYLEKTMDINIYDEIFTGLTNPKHDTKVKNLLVSVSNGAVETLVKTSHQVLTGSGSRNRGEDVELGVGLPLSQSSCVARSGNGGGWMDGISSALADPGNRRFVFDVIVRTAFEMVRSFFDFMVQKLCETGRRTTRIVHREVLERGLEILRYISAKSMLILTICLALALCFHVVSGTGAFVQV